MAGAAMGDLMMAACLLSAKWLLACVGSVGIGVLAWLLLNGAAQVWPALRTRRAIWLAAQLMVAAAALLPFLPHHAQLEAAPRIVLAPAAFAAATPAPARPTGAVPATAPFHADSNAAAPAALPPLHDDGDAIAPTSGGVTLPLLAGVWLLVYAAGLAWALSRLLRAFRLWRGLLAGADRLAIADLQDHAAFSAAQLREISQRGLSVMRTDAAISPMLVGVRRPVLLLPPHLDALSTEQQHMIIAHELHHWRARDPLCLAIAALLQTVFWFNPALRWMARQMAWALELQCDQHVLAGRPQHQRKQYAASLLQPWAATMGVAAFNGATVAARIRHMQQGGLPTLSKAAACATAIALAALLSAGAMLQPALAISGPGQEPMSAAKQTSMPEFTPVAARSPAAEAMPPPAAGVWRAPLDKVRVTSFFGVKRSVPRTPHKGIDFGAAKGTPVHATASGVVIAAGPIAENDGKYGNTVIIDHGAQRSLYAHLNSVSVQPGQRVEAGQVIGAVGETGLATGPHLHLEVRRNGQIVDPAPLFSNLDAYATARALKVRRQQLPSKG